jgi:hypothetical protein
MKSVKLVNRNNIAGFIIAVAVVAAAQRAWRVSGWAT